MSFRITQRSVAMRVLDGLQGNLERLGTTQQRLSSGKLVSKPSDSPTAAVSSMQLRAGARAQAQYSRNATDGLGWLNTIDTALTSTLDNLRRVRDLTVQGMSTGSAGPDARAAIAKEVSQIRDAVIGLANTRYLDRPVFGGTTSKSAAFSSPGAFIGDPDTTVARTIAPGTTVKVNINGEKIFADAFGNNGALTVVANIADHLVNDPAQLSTDLGNLDLALKNITEKLATVGASVNRLETARATADLNVDTLKTQLSDVEDIDLPKTL
ncbi:MAG TPA: flagellar hook-associated protein FlgL, partial [Actinomycetes bacterium]|nr:flagellar hook-associated protein FlgL [Actinomycetes bacterium]